MRSVFLAMASFTGSNRMHATFTMPVGQFASAAAWQPFGQKLLPFVDRIPNDPVSYPFALNESEFRNDANALFGGEMENLSASYQPASFYADIAKTAALALIGFAATSAAVSMLPEMVALGAVGAKVIPGAVSALAGGVGGSMLAAAFPTNIGEDLKKAALLPVYRNESLRRRVD